MAPSQSKRNDGIDQEYRGHSELSSWNRGEASPRLILGAFFLLLIGGPLIGAAISLQNGLSESPAFSGLTAGIVALLFLLAIASAVLGLD